MVETFELTRAGLVRTGAHDSFIAAAACLPDGAYTSFRTYGKDRVLRFERHVARLLDSVARLGTPASLDAEALRRGVAAALATAPHPESRVRLTFAPPRLFVSLEPFTPLPDAAYREGVACATLVLAREDARSKDTRFIAKAASAHASLPPEAHEGLLLAADGAILEGLTSNFFAVRGGELLTEQERALPGVTRALVLELAARLLPVRPAALRIDQLVQASECFLTSVSRGLLPVVRIDGRAIGDGPPGPVTRELMRRLAALVAREAVSLGRAAGPQDSHEPGLSE